MGRYLFITKTVLLSVLLLLLQQEVRAQLTTLTLQPGSAGIDAKVSSSSSTTNFGTATTLTASRNASGSATDTTRSYIKFDLSSIPANAVIYEAKLYLFGLAHSSGNNACHLERVITTSWGETTITWSNKSPSTTTGQHAIASTTNTTKDDTVDVTSDVQAMYANSSTNYGWVLKLQSESVQGAKREYASSDNATSTKWPKLVVKYYFPMTFNTTVTSYPCSGGTNIGAIDLTVNNGVPPYTYSWSPGGATTQDISSLARGTYTVTVTDAINNTKTTAVGVGYQQVWTYFYAMTTSGDTLVQTFGSNNWFDNGTSINRLNANTDGWVEYTIQSTTLDKTFGLADTNTTPGLNDIDYGVYIKNATTNNLIRIENGTQTVIGNYKLGDVIRIERVGSTIYYKQNGTTLSTKTGASTGALAVETAIWTNGGKFKNIRTSFPISGIYYWAGKISADWSNSSNWSSCAGVPTSANDVIIPQGATNMPVISAADAVCKNMMIGPSATLTINDPRKLSVNGNFTNNGTFTSTSGTVEFTGAVDQSVSTSGTGLTMNGLSLNKSAGKVTLLKPVTVSTALTLTKGKIVSSSTNLLTLNDNATLTGGSDTGYVSGPMKKIGNDAFTFPLGSVSLVSGAYHPLTITAPAVATDAFTAEYKSTAQGYGSGKVDSLDAISNCEYWTVDRIAGTSNIKATLGWNSNSCQVDDYDNLRISGWDGTKWIDLGNGGATSGLRYGSVVSGNNVTFVSNAAALTFGQASNRGYATLRRKLDGQCYVIKNGSLYFKYDEEYNDVDNLLTFNIYNKANVPVVTNASLNSPLSSDLGDNRYFINVSNCALTNNGNLSAGYYILEVVNEKGEKWYLRFQNIVTITTLCTPIDNQQ